MTTTKVLEYFASLVADENGIPLTETVLSIAQDAYPDLDLQAELAALDMLAVRLKRRVAEGTPAIQRMRLLNHFFYRDLGFGANAPRRRRLGSRLGLRPHVGACNGRWASSVYWLQHRNTSLQTAVRG